MTSVPLAHEFVHSVQLAPELRHLTSAFSVFHLPRHLDGTTWLLVDTGLRGKRPLAVDKSGPEPHISSTPPPPPRITQCCFLGHVLIPNGSQVSPSFLCLVFKRIPWGWTGPFALPPHCLETMASSTSSEWGAAAPVLPCHSCSSLE